VSYRATVLADSPLAYWRLGEAAGATTAADEMGGAPGTYAGGVTLGQPGALTRDTNLAALFDGVNGVVSAGNVFGFAALAPFSVECWVYLTALPAATFSRLISKETTDGSGRQGWDVVLSPTSAGAGAGKVTFEVWLNGVSAGAVTAAAIPLNAWNHIVCTMNGTNPRIFLNGVQQATGAAAPSMIAHTNPLRFAAHSSSGGFLPGTLDEIALYGAALTPTQVAAHYVARLLSDFATWAADVNTDRVVLADIQVAEVFTGWTQVATLGPTPSTLLFGAQSFNTAPVARAAGGPASAGLWVDPYLLVAVFRDDTVSASSVTSVSWQTASGTEQLTQLATQAQGALVVEWWGKAGVADPGVGGTSTITATLSAARPGGLIYYAFAGVDQTTPLGVISKAGSASTSAPSLTPASAVTDLVVDVLAALVASVTMTPGAGQTELPGGEQVAPGPAAPVYDTSTATGTAGTTTMSWTLGSAQATVQMAVAVKAAQSRAYAQSFPTQVRTTVVPGGVYRRLDVVYQDGLALTSVASQALCEATPGTFYFNATTETLYVRTSTASSPLVFSFVGPIFTFFVANVAKAFRGQPLYEPRLTGDAPHVEAQAREPLLGVKTYSSGDLTLTNADGLFDTLCRTWAWEGRQVTIRIGGGDLDWSDYQVMAIMAIAKAPAAADLSAPLPLLDVTAALDTREPHQTWQAGGWASLADTTVPVTDYMPKFYGRVVGIPAVYALANDPFNTGFAQFVIAGWDGLDLLLPFTIDRVRARARATGVITTLPASDYLIPGVASGVIDIVSATWPAATYEFFVDATATVNTVGQIAYRLLRGAGVPDAAMDLASFAQADVDCPFVIGLYLEGGTTLSVGELLEQLERSTLSRVSRTGSGLWAIQVWNPVADLSGLPVFLEGEVANFQPDDQVTETLAMTVRVNYGTDRLLETTPSASKTDGVTQYARNNTRTLAVDTGLTASDDAAVMASRLAWIASSSVLRVTMQLPPRALLFDVWSRARFNRSRAPNEAGAFVNTVLEIDQFDKNLATGEVTVAVTNNRGVGTSARWSQADGSVDWDGADATAREQYGFAEDDTTERVDAADATTYRAGGVTW
jgi:hypothetical protein